MSATQTYLGGGATFISHAETCRGTVSHPFIPVTSVSEKLPALYAQAVTVSIKTRPLPYEGNFRITGVAKRKFGTLEYPTRARIVLVDEITGNFVAQTYSNQDTGIYNFDNIANVKYTIMGFANDETPAVIADNIQPEPMP